ncbi:hypothetical protein MNBD_CHLOROFLEXI01-1036 [hydrothermal vent metagenome]|uniref:Uncharacterized protein n=1 Tax=hydrothermal vent metagenome TaxID=652676 RepID=A0A3B0VLQ8_9ZZZZ
MLMTYKAILRGNRLEWSETAPKQLTENKPVSVVTVLDETTLAKEKALQGKKMALALEALSKLSPVSITDPAVWERAQRQERKLPQRA